MSIIYIIEKQGKRYRETDKATVVDLCSSKGYTFVAQAVTVPLINLLPKPKQAAR